MPTKAFYDNVAILQKFAGTTVDREFGPQTAAALVKKLGLQGTPVPTGYWTETGRASSFADPADIRAFDKCKATGKSDEECFAVGDNGEGCWGDNTRAGSGPSCAVPPDNMIAEFGSVAKAKHAKIRVQCNGREIILTLKDRMKWKKNITNGTVIDLNPDAAAEFGLKPPFLTSAKWAWV